MVNTNVTEDSTRIREAGYGILTTEVHIIIIIDQNLYYYVDFCI